MSRDSGAANLRNALRALRRRLAIFISCLVLVPAGAVAFSLFQQKEYTASAALLFRDPQFDQKLFGTSYVQTQTDPARAAATDVDLVSLRRVAALTAAQLHNITEDNVSKAVHVGSSSQSDVVSVQAHAKTSAYAAKLANAYADEFIAFRQAADRSTVRSAEVPLRRQIAALPPRQRYGQLGQSLQQRLSQLNTLAMLQTGGAELVQPAEIPTSTSSPKPVQDGVFGLFFGLLLGGGLVALAEVLDRRLRDPAELDELYERPLLAAVPRSTTLPGANPSLSDVPPAELEAFRMLWVNLRYFSLSRDIRSVLITSADRDDGKSTVAWGLAVSAASAGVRTILIEADLRNPTLAKRFNAPVKHGLTNALAGDLSRSAATMRLRLAPSGDDPSSSRFLDVLFAGHRPPDPTDVLQSPRMAEFLRDIQSDYDLVIIDTPPAALVSDAIPLIAMVHGVIVVSRLGNTLREHARRLRQQLDHLPTPVLGTVINSMEGPHQYGYDEYDPPAADSRQERTIGSDATAPSASHQQAEGERASRAPAPPGKSAGAVREWTGTNGHAGQPAQADGVSGFIEPVDG